MPPLCPRTAEDLEETIAVLSDHDDSGGRQAPLALS